MTDFVTSHCITLNLIGQTIKLLGKSQTQENGGLAAHQPPIGLQYSTTCSTNNTKHRTQICTLVRSLPKAFVNRGRHNVRVAPNGHVLAGLSDAHVGHPIGERRLVSSYDQRRAPNNRGPPGRSRSRHLSHCAIEHPSSAATAILARSFASRSSMF